MNKKEVVKKTKMTTLEIYKAETGAEEQLQKFMIKFYRNYWNKFMSKLNCSALHALAKYKQGTEWINGILWIDENINAIREVSYQHLLDHHTCISFFSTVISKQLRKVLTQIRTLDKLFTHCPQLEEDMTVYRGVLSNHAKLYTEMKRGSVIKSKGFVSTSLKFNYSVNIPTYPTDSNDYGVMLEIHLPAGTPYLLLPGNPGTSALYGDVKTFKDLLHDTSFSSDEFEILLDRNSSFKLVNAQKIRLKSIADFKAKSFSDKSFISLYKLEYIRNTGDKHLPTETEILNTVQHVSIPIVSRNTNYRDGTSTSNTL